MAATYYHPSPHAIKWGQQTKGYLKMSNDPLDYDAIRRRVDERINKRKEFFAHLAAYILTNIAVWVTYLLISPPGLWVLIPLLVTLGWGIGIVIHGSITFFEA